MKKLVGQLILTGILLSCFTLLVLPTGKIHAAAQTPNWPERPLATISGTTWHGASAISCNGYINYAYTGTNGNLNIAIDDGLSGVFNTTTYTDTSQETPSIACWQNKLWIAWQANDTSHAIHVADAEDATCPGSCSVGTYWVLAKGNILPNSQATLGIPQLGVNGSTMFLAYKWTTNGNITVDETTTGTTWIKQTTITGNSTSNEPSLTSYGGKLIIAWAGTDIPAHINFATYSDGNATLSNKVVASDTTYGAINTSIGLSTYNNRIQFAFQASDTSSLIYTGSWSSSTGYVHNGPLGGSYTNNDVGLVGLNVYYSDSSSNPYTLKELQMPG